VGTIALALMSTGATPKHWYTADSKPLQVLDLEADTFEELGLQSAARAASKRLQH